MRDSIAICTAPPGSVDGGSPRTDAPITSDTLMTGIVEGLADVVWAKDLQGRYVYVNRAGAAMIGRTPDQVVGRTEAELFPAQQARMFREKSRQVAATGVPVTVEHGLDVADGRHVTYLTTESPLRDAAGRVVGVMGTCCDITDRKRAEQALRDSHHRLTEVMESITDGFFGCDPCWRLTYVNRQAERFVGLSPDRDTGRVLWEVRPDASAQFRRELTRAMTDRASVSFETAYRGRWWGISAYPGRDGGLAVYFRDVTERETARLALQESEARYHQLFDTIPAPCFVFDPGTLRILEVNRTATRVYGWSRDEALAMTLMDVRDPDYHPHLQALRANWPDGPADHGLVRHRTKSGVSIWVEVKSEPIDFAGRPARIGVVTDVTERELVRHRAAASERTAQATLDALPKQIALLDASGTILSVNRSWRKFGEANGRRAVPETAENYLAVCDQAAAGGDADAARAGEGIREVLAGRSGSFYMEYPCHSPAVERWFAMRVTRVADEGPVRVAVAHEDVTERRRAEALERDRATLSAAIASMERVLGVVGHELRTPLAGLRAIGELMVSVPDRSGEQFGRLARAVHDEAVRMSDTVDQLLEAARLNSGQARWEWTRFDAGAPCVEAIETIRPLLDESRVCLCVSAGSPDTLMAGDRDAVRRLVLNLLGNARKHTADGHIRLSWRVERAPRATGGEVVGWVVIVVKDTGPGIKPSLLPRLGEAFALNGGSVGANHVDGAGLGLAICRGIVAAHGGDLTIRSAPGRGTEVTARLRADLPGPVTSPPGPGSLFIGTPVPAGRDAA